MIKFFMEFEKDFLDQGYSKNGYKDLLNYLIVLDENEDSLYNAVSFEFNGIAIVHPFYTEDSMDIVNPIKYYGEAFLKSDLFKKFK